MTSKWVADDSIHIDLQSKYRILKKYIPGIVVALLCSLNGCINSSALMAAQPLISARTDAKFSCATTITQEAHHKEDISQLQLFSDLIYEKKWGQAVNLAQKNNFIAFNDLEIENCYAIALWHLGDSNQSKKVLENALSRYAAFLNLRQIYRQQAAKSYAIALGISNNDQPIQFEFQKIEQGLLRAGPLTSPNKEAPSNSIISGHNAPSPDSQDQINPHKAIDLADTIANLRPLEDNLETLHTAKIEAPMITSQKHEALNPYLKSTASGSDTLESQRSSQFSQVESALNQWSLAWSNKDVENYLSHYSKNFIPDSGLSLSSWKTQRVARLGRDGKIYLELDNIRIFQSEGKIVSDFRQKYRSNELKLMSTKRLVWVLENERWLILRESNRSN
jgi:hypothetical protein